MDTVLVVNAGSSSVNPGLRGAIHRGITRKIKGQIDSIGTRPQLRARGADGTNLIDREYEAARIADVSAALHTAGAWLPGRAAHTAKRGRASGRAWRPRVQQPRRDRC